MHSLKQSGFLLLILTGLSACGESVQTQVEAEEVSRLYRVDSGMGAKASKWLFCYQQPSRSAPVVFDLREGDELRSLSAPMPLGRSQWLYARPAHNEKAAACYVRRQHVQTVQSAAVTAN